MTFGSDDLAPLLVSPKTGAVRYGQGVIISWNQTTFENVVEWNGARLRNLPVLSGTDALTYREGETVGLLGWDPGGRKGSSSWWILGRLILPGGNNAESVISWMTGSLGQAVAREVISETVHSETADNSVIYNSDTSGFEAVSGGPELSGVEVVTGKLLVMVTMHCLVQDIAGLYLGHRLTGPETVEPEQEQSAFIRGRVETSTVRNPMFATTYTNLTPGTYTVEARALAEDVQGISGVDDVELGVRSLIAIAY